MFVIECPIFTSELRLFVLALEHFHFEDSACRLRYTSTSTRRVRYNRRLNDVRSRNGRVVDGFFGDILGCNRYVFLEYPKVMRQRFIVAEDFRTCTVRFTLFKNDISHKENPSARWIVHAVSATSQIPDHPTFPALPA